MKMKISIIIKSIVVIYIFKMLWLLREPFCNFLMIQRSSSLQSHIKCDLVVLERKQHP